MSFVSVTRLKVRSFRFVPSFLLEAFRIRRQVAAAPGFQSGALLADRNWTFWTMTTWDDPESMRRFMTNSPHLTAMPRLLDWCDEASVAHWEQLGDAPPSWPEADKRMRALGRASKVSFPSPFHAELTYPPPRVAAEAKIARKGAK